MKAHISETMREVWRIKDAISAETKGMAMADYFAYVKAAAKKAFPELQAEITCAQPQRSAAMPKGIAADGRGDYHVRTAKR